MRGNVLYERVEANGFIRTTAEIRGFKTKSAEPMSSSPQAFKGLTVADDNENIHLVLIYELNKYNKLLSWQDALH